MKDNMNIYFAFIMCLGFTICILSIVGIHSKNQHLQTEIDELRLLFNQNFLQEMIKNKPNIRSLREENNSLYERSCVLKFSI